MAVALPPRRLQRRRASPLCPPPGDLLVLLRCGRRIVALLPTGATPFCSTPTPLSFPSLPRRSWLFWCCFLVCSLPQPHARERVVCVDHSRPCDGRGACVAGALDDLLCLVSRACSRLCFMIFLVFSTSSRAASIPPPVHLRAVLALGARVCVVEAWASRRHPPPQDVENDFLLPPHPAHGLSRSLCP